jgi:hypothetical protein
MYLYPYKIDKFLKYHKREIVKLPIDYQVTSILSYMETLIVHHIMWLLDDSNIYDIDMEVNLNYDNELKIEFYCTDEELNSYKKILGSYFYMLEDDYFLNIEICNHGVSDN